MGAAEWCVCERFWFFLFFSGGMGREADLDFMTEKWDGGNVVNGNAKSVNL